MKAVIKGTMGLFLIVIGLSCFSNNFCAVNAGLFFMVGGLFCIPAYWNLVKVESPKKLRSSDQIIVVSFNIFVGLCLLTLVFPGVGITDGERAYATKDLGQPQAVQKVIKGPEENPIASTSSSLKPAVRKGVFHFRQTTR